ncbi:MAG: hypothetical protein OXD46_14940 [Chloroflexi bacterium]|nr:hypothetical protein [Chloroflexota bacterium]
MPQRSEDLRFDPEAVKILFAALLESAEARLKPDDLSQLVEEIETVLGLLQSPQYEQELSPVLREQVARLVVLYRELAHLILVELKDPPPGKLH